MIVSREAAVSGFVSEPFYTPEIDCGQRDAAPTFRAAGTRESSFEAAEAVRVATDGRDAIVLSVEKIKKTAAPPKLYDLTTLQREANRLFGFTAQQTLDYVQSLYEKKLCSYPRTDSRYLSGDMRESTAAIIAWIQKDMGYKDGADFTPDVAKLINDKAVTDHHAIIPTAEMTKADLSALPSGECDVLNLIACRLLCAVAPTHAFEATTAVLECGGHKFTAKGKTIITDGWKAIDDAFKGSLKQRPPADEDDTALPDGGRLPELAEGQVFPSVTASVKEGKTSPPRRYTEDTLLSAMETAGAEDFPDEAERRGLGTPATRAATIEKLIKSGFVERQKKNLIPTQRGINLIAVLPDTVKSPLLTAEWEQKLRLVELGELTETAFMDGIAAMTRKLVADHTAPIEEYKALFAAAPDSKGVTKRDPLIGACPRCGSGVADRPKGFFCSSRECKFVLWKDNRFFEAKKKKLTKTVAAALLKEGRVFFSDLYSERTGKTYAAAIVLEDTGDKTNYKLDFSGKGGTA
jgi:DNA topoisomerase-3